MVAARGIGLAATQVGWDARVCIVSDTGEPDDCLVLINPVIEESWGSEAMEEGCLSFPGVNAVITRALGVKIRFTGLDGEEYTLEDEDLLGRCCLHEIDHLDGVTFLGKMTPADKLQQVQALRQQGAVVVMVGDGINDAPVLAAADVSIVMRDAAHISQASADMVLLSSNLGALDRGIQLSRKTLGIIKQNLSWAVGYNLVALPAAAMGFVAPWMAAIGMSSSSLLVVLNALRLTRSK